MSLPGYIHRSSWLPALGLVLSLQLGCGAGDDSEAADAAPTVADGGAAPDADGEPCTRELGPANGKRFVVVARPYGEGGAQATGWELLELSDSGALGATGTFFSMGRATGGVVAFTPDGEIGLVAQDDGSVGVFRIDETGQVTVLNEGLKGSFYAGQVVMSQGGDVAYVLSENFRNNGGGIYQLAIGCDGSVKDEGMLEASKLPRGMLWRDDGSSVIAAHDLGDSSLEQDIHLVIDGNFESPASSAAVFSDREGIVGSIAMTADEKFVLVGDNSGFSGVDNRVGVARLGASSLEAVQVLTPLLDPYAMATSPFDDAAIVVSGFGDAIFKLSYDPTSNASPFAIDGEVAYEGSDPQLPGDLVQILRGDLLGLVLIVENQGLRRVQFDGTGGVNDLGLSAFGDSYAAIGGAIGVQP